jgi:hypothetical protein
MMNKFSRRPVATGGLLLAAALACGSIVSWSDTQAQATGPSANFHIIDSGSQALHNSCFHLAGSIGQAVPGYSSSTGSPSYSVNAGFWAAAPTANRDEIFFNGFEGC